MQSEQSNLAIGGERARIGHRIAEAALAHYSLPQTTRIDLVNVSENVTLAISPRNGRRFALRVHRPDYHSRAAIESELAWLIALDQSGAARTPRPVRGSNGEWVQSIAVNATEPRHVVLFEWENGREPDRQDETVFARLGAQAARLHDHIDHWSLPVGFTRHSWTFATSLGASPHWGRWQEGIGMTPALLALFGRTVALLEQRLAAFGMARHRFGLVHGDMRLANILLDGEELKLIDFDDCGFSWLLYDCATTVSFFEHEPQVPDLLKAWVRGYRTVRDLPEADAEEIPTFVMLRRLLLVAWLGSRPDTELATQLGAQYTATTAKLCEAYLDRFTIPKP